MTGYQYEYWYLQTITLKILCRNTKKSLTTLISLVLRYKSLVPVSSTSRLPVPKILYRYRVLADQNLQSLRSGPVSMMRIPPDPDVQHCVHTYKKDSDLARVSEPEPPAARVFGWSRHFGPAPAPIPNPNPVPAPAPP